MGSSWIDPKCSSQYVLTSPPPLIKHTPTEGLLQAREHAHWRWCSPPIMVFIYIYRRTGWKACSWYNITNRCKANYGNLKLGIPSEEMTLQSQCSFLTYCKKWYTLVAVTVSPHFLRNCDPQVYIVTNSTMIQVWLKKHQVRWILYTCYLCFHTDFTCLC